MNIVGEISRIIYMNQELIWAGLVVFAVIFAVVVIGKLVVSQRKKAEFLHHIERKVTQINTTVNAIKKDTTTCVNACKENSYKNCGNTTPKTWNGRQELESRREPADDNSKDSQIIYIDNRSHKDKSAKDDEVRTLTDETAGTIAVAEAAKAAAEAAKVAVVMASKGAQQNVELRSTDAADDTIKAGESANMSETITEPVSTMNRAENINDMQNSERQSREAVQVAGMQAKVTQTGDVQMTATPVTATQAGAVQMTDTQIGGTQADGTQTTTAQTGQLDLTETIENSASVHNRFETLDWATSKNGKSYTIEELEEQIK